MAFIIIDSIIVIIIIIHIIIIMTIVINKISSISDWFLAHVNKNLHLGKYAVHFTVFIQLLKSFTLQKNPKIFDPSVI